VRELAVRLSVPIRHRYSLAGMADVLKRLRQEPPRRPQPGQLRSYGVPLALTAQRMSFQLTGEGREAYDLWAAELERLGLWAAPFEPRHDEDEGEERAPQRPARRQQPRTQVLADKPALIFPEEPIHDERALDDLIEPSAAIAAPAEAAAPTKKRRRRRRRPAGGTPPTPAATEGS